MSSPNNEPVFKRVSFESDLTPEQIAADFYRDSLLFIKGHLDAHGVDPRTVLSDQELADALAFEQVQHPASISSHVLFGSPEEGYFTTNDDGTLLSWGTNPYGEYSKPVVLPIPETNPDAI